MIILSEDKAIARNTTGGGARFDYAYGRSMLCDWVQGRFALVAAVVCVAAAILVICGCFKIAAYGAGWAVILIWMRPAFGFASKAMPYGEISVMFYEDHYKAIQNSQEKILIYSNIRRITDFGQRILIEDKRARLLLSKDGFEGMTGEEFLAHLQKRSPKLRIKRKNLYPVVWNGLRLVGVTLLLIGVVLCGAFLRPALVMEMPQSYAESDLLRDRPLTTYDLDLLSISLPMGLQVDDETDDGYYIERTLYSNQENTQIRVIFEPRETTGNLGKTITEYAQNVLDATLEGNGVATGSKGVFRNGNGNPCFTARLFDCQFYCVVLETEYYFITLFFFADITQYAAYRPHFEAWAAGAHINDTPTGSILNQRQTWSFDRFEITVPAYFDAVPDETVDLLLWSPQNDIGIQIECLEKDGMSMEEAYRKWLGEGFEETILVTSSAGNPSYAFRTEGYVVYTCCVESEEAYIFAIFTCYEENYTDHGRYFRAWEETLVGK